MDFSTWTDEALRERNEALGAGKLALRAELEATLAEFATRKAALVAERTAIGEELARRAAAPET